MYASLLAIHRAQERSIALLAGATPPPARTLVEIAVEKGGTSVLADGYLVAGSLTPGQVECIFGLGVFLQLRDDLEDVDEDGAAGVMTVFSTRRDDRLDEPTARALAVGAAVLARLSCFDSPQAAPVCDIMSRSLQLTIADAAASFPARYSGPCLRATRDPLAVPLRVPCRPPPPPVSRQRLADRSARTVDRVGRFRESGVRSQDSGVRSQASGSWGQGSGVGDQGASIRVTFEPLPALRTGAR